MARCSSTPLPNAPDLPRILVLSGAVPETRFAGSLLLYRLLLKYPADRLYTMGVRTHPKSELLECPYVYLPPARSSRLNLTRFAALKRSLETIGVMGRIPASRVDAALNGFTPDVVVSVMERRDYVDAAHRLCLRRGLPLVLIVHDRLESFELVYPPFRAAQIAANARIYRFASARLCVSPEMVQSLDGVYGARGSVMYPNRSDALSARPAEESRQLKAPPKLTLGYAGSLSYGYGDRLRELMPDLAGAGVALRLYSHDVPAVPIAGAEHAGGFAADVLWERVKRECDGVWLPYSNHEHFQPLYRTHFPSKLTEYMALGMPVVITGPADATGVKWGLAHPDATLTLPDGGATEIRAALDRLRSDPAARVSIAAASRGGDRDFDPAMIRRQFVNVIQNVSERRVSSH
jgi:glycosyltransferase involved in cell wall biosynthesis